MPHSYIHQVSPRKFHRPYFKIRPRVAGDAPWRMDALCTSYGWPTGLAGNGKAAIVSLGGGYYPSDIAKFFGRLKLPKPNITDFAVDPGAGNSPGNDADVENHLDIMAVGVAFAKATGRPANIGMFFANNDLNGIARAVAMASAEGYDSCSISWGSAYELWAGASAQQMEQAAIAAVTNGMIIWAASGDADAGDSQIKPSVDLPSGCPHVIACGGTRRPHNSSPTNPEVVWDDNPNQLDGDGTGGGFLQLFPRPAWQIISSNYSSFVGRMVPDVAANSDPVTGVHVLYQGQDIVVGGTSFSAPYYNGFACAWGEKLGFIAPVLYQHPECFRDITVGGNGFYNAAVGPDPCTGIGSLRASMLAALFVKS